MANAQSVCMLDGMKAPARTWNIEKNGRSQLAAYRLLLSAYFPLVSVEKRGMTW